MGKCQKCGLEITTGVMAAYCPQATECVLWPTSDSTPAGDGAELLMARMWIRNALVQLGMQIEDRRRLRELLARAQLYAHGKYWPQGLFDQVEGMLKEEANG